ncbi:Uncharacterised protein [Moraxella caprae]|uniref:Single-stranded DNA-binding protein n=1 Tax=Moraxella caprae TaxID=90240 RepID=A0A378QZT8_9GAMM|nr:hypothetical protein [Moraxella caprae]STZ08298.1 Uncharacterised protein [Moraxella caprae]
MQQVTILGVKRSQGTLDNGKAYNSTKIYVQTKMKETIDQAGFGVAEYAWGDSSNFEKINKLSFPFLANIDLETVTNGKTVQLVVNDVVPITNLNDKSKIV